METHFLLVFLSPSRPNLQTGPGLCPSHRPHSLSPEAAIDPSVTEPLRHPDFFGVRELFTMSELFDARVHLGHREGSLNPYMAEFLLGSRLGHCVFDLERTAQLLRDALNFTAHMAYRGGIIMFVCRAPQHVHLVGGWTRGRGGGWKVWLCITAWLLCDKKIGI